MWTIVALATLGLVAGMARGADFPPGVVGALEKASYLYVATRRADGTRSKVVPVWFMWDGSAIWFTTVPTSHKAKRIAKGSPLYVAVGSEDGPSFVGTAELVADPAQAERMAPVYNGKYWIAWLGFFRPRPERVRDGRTVLVKVVPADPPA
jgi:PPOX class probable F420-dependent enzyme